MEKIWNLSSSANMMDEADFYVAVRFVALHQSHFAISKEIFVEKINDTLSLPRFTDFEFQQPVSTVPNIATEAVQQDTYDQVGSINNKSFQAAYHCIDC